MPWGRIGKGCDIRDSCIDRAFIGVIGAEPFSDPALDKSNAPESVVQGLTDPECCVDAYSEATLRGGDPEEEEIGDVSTGKFRIG